jgi:iron(III) transport system permease protein
MKVTELLPETAHASSVAPIAPPAPSQTTVATVTKRERQQKRETIDLVYHGYVFDASGYGQAARAYIHALHGAGVNVAVVDLANHARQVPDKLIESLANRSVDADFHLFHGIPPLWARRAFPLRNVIAMTVWPNVGLLNQWLGAVLPGINVYSYTGLIVLGAVRSATVLFLFVHPAFLAMDATLEEAARMAGASARLTLWRINLPLLLPALLASGILSFVVAMESFELPQLLGTPARIFVFTTKIYDLAYGGHVASFGPAMVLAVLLLILTLSLIVLQWKLLKGRAYTTISGRGYQARPLDLGPWRWVPFSFIVAFFAVFGALPFAVLLLNSFMEISGFLSWEMLTTRHWTDALGRTAVLTSVRDTLIVSVTSATLGIIASALIAYVVTRTTWPGRKVLDMVAWAPWAVPGLVMSLGFLWAFVGLPIYGTLWLLVLVFVARGLPVGSRFFTATMVQVGAELEESARIHGGSWLRTFVRIWVPLLRPAILGAWILLFVIAVRVLDLVVLLAGPGSRMLSVDIFLWTVTGRQEAASVLALLQTALVLAGYVAARWLLGRTPRQGALPH